MKYGNGPGNAGIGTSMGRDHLDFTGNTVSHCTINTVSSVRQPFECRIDTYRDGGVFIQSVERGRNLVKKVGLKYDTFGVGKDIAKQNSGGVYSYPEPGHDPYPQAVCFLTDAAKIKRAPIGFHLTTNTHYKCG